MNESRYVQGGGCHRLPTCEQPVKSVTQVEQETIKVSPWRKWQWPAVAHCKGGC